MRPETLYRRFAVSSLNSTEGVTDPSDKVGLLIMAEAWLDLAKQTTQVVDHEADEAHFMIEQPLKRASVQDHQHSENRRQVIMPTRDDDYQTMAEECFRRAREAESDRERQGYLELAQTWLEAASKVDCVQFLSLPSRCWR